MLTKTLSISDLIDFDYYLSGIDLSTYNEDERLLFINRIEPALKACDKKNADKIASLWIQAKRENSAKISPGRVYNSAARFIFLIFALTGLVTGIGAATSYLSYSGTRPVNISIYIFVFVFFPVILILLSTISLMASRIKLMGEAFQGPYSLMLALIKKTASLGLDKLSGGNKLAFEASIGKIKMNRGKYGELYFQTVFAIFQFTGLMFSSGILLATLFKVITSDIAFGWQTTIQTAPEKIYDLVRYVSTPWSWLLTNEVAHPTLKQIEGSQIILKDNIVNLISADMASWWPFLCLAVIFYTIIPRTLLFAVGLISKKRTLNRTGRKNIAKDKLIHLLTSKHMVFEKNGSNGSNSPRTSETFSNTADSVVSPTDDRIVALIPEDIFSREFTDLMGEQVGNTLGTINNMVMITGDVEEDKAVIKEVLDSFHSDQAGVLLIVFEAWLPPIKETIDYIKDIRQRAGNAVRITVWLTGKPLPGGLLNAGVKESDFKVWNWKIDAIGDENISVILAS